MKKLSLIGILSILWSSLSFALPQEALLHFTLSEVREKSVCPAQMLSMLNAPAAVDYSFDFKRNIGQAHLRQLKDVAWLEALFPLGLTNLYAFMSDMKPRKVVFGDGTEVVVTRILFHLYKEDNTSRLLLMLGEKGECILQSEKVPV